MTKKLKAMDKIEHTKVVNKMTNVINRKR